MSKNKAFRNVVVCHTDDFPPNKNDKIKGWVEAHGGTFTKTLTPEVTHFIVSKQAWKKYPPAVRAARRQNNTKVVNFDWLEDSLLSSNRRPKDARAYEWDRVSAKKKMKDTQKIAARDKQIERALVKHEIAVTDFERETGHSGYHIYTDDTHFTYSLTLVRADILSNRNQFHKLKVRYTSHIPPSVCARTTAFSFNSSTNPCPVPLYFFPSPHPLSRRPVAQVCLPPRLRLRRHPPHYCRVPVANPWAQTLQLYESDAVPHRYMALSRYIQPGKTATAELSPVGSRFDVAFVAFKKFFQLKTNVEWEARCQRKQSDRCCDQSNVDDGCDGHFRYQLPGHGKPKGAMKQSTLTEHLMRNRAGSSDTSGEVMVLMPSVEVEDDEIECSARTPDGGW